MNPSGSTKTAVNVKYTNERPDYDESRISWI